jgi:hypothetical protein
MIQEILKRLFQICKMMRLFEKYRLKALEINCSLCVITEDKELRILSHFLDFWNKSKDIKEDLLPELELVLNGTLTNNDIGADVIGQAYVKHDITVLDMSELGFSDMELPTEDFEGLIIEWLEFLESQGR